MHRVMLLGLPLAMANQAEAHLSHSAQPVHAVEHLLLLAAFLIPVLLARPLLRLFARTRKPQD